MGSIHTLPAASRSAYNLSHTCSRCSFSCPQPARFIMLNLPFFYPVYESFMLASLSSTPTLDNKSNRLVRHAHLPSESIHMAIHTNTGARRIQAHTLMLSYTANLNSHARTHARKHARTHARTHTTTHSVTCIHAGMHPHPHANPSREQDILLTDTHVHIQRHTKMELISSLTREVNPKGAHNT